ncbi:MAG: phosphoribosylformylglycinamidine cyclo-ligase [Gammaproteobacteria bacterium]|nr:phosphoribosylformylglycinamidine cyclo-ligase [Gammaproteobacteria bacterium]
MVSEKPLPATTYREAGVDIDAGNALVEQIKPAVRSTHTPEVLGDLGGFGGLCKLPDHYRQPVLVAGTDGVGTKLLLAQRFDRHATIGIDLVAMCVNDVIVQGAAPLFFLDYYATGRLDPAAAGEVIEGIAAGCRAAGAALLGGETAEMPGMYRHGHYDLAGFCVGVVERDKIITGANVAAGDRIVGLASSGAHANGYSLIRHVLESVAHTLDTEVGGKPLADALMEATHIYVQPLLALYREVDVHAVAHITGGGIVENLPRVLPHDCTAHINTGSWQRPALFDWLQIHGNIADEEMWRTFNCGVGMVVVVAKEDLDQTLATFAEHRQDAWVLGTVVASTGAPAVVLRP